MRVGKIKVPQFMLYDEYVTLRTILGELGFVPLDVQRFDYYEFVTYVGVSDKFDELLEGEKIPEYSVSISTENGHVVNVEVRRND